MKLATPGTFAADPATVHALYNARYAPQDFRALVPARDRGSTVLFDRHADARDDRRGEGYTYGPCGTPITRELALRIADLEQALARAAEPAATGCRTSTAC